MIKEHISTLLIRYIKLHLETSLRECKDDWLAPYDLESLNCYSYTRLKYYLRAYLKQ